MTTVVNGDLKFGARTTRRAVGLLLAASKPSFKVLHLDQVVGPPIGSGFGASAASATSAVYAAAAAMGITGTKRDFALFAHRAEITEQTGLGTVSVVYDGAGAGAIVVPGEPGAAEFLNVDVPKDTRIVTACISPYDKKDALSSGKVREKINRLGDMALQGFLADPSIDTLAEEGERFSRNLGLETPEVRKLERVAKAAGAMYASQNMIGYAIHALVHASEAKKVADALSGLNPIVRVDVFEVGTNRAGVVQVTRR